MSPVGGSRATTRGAAHDRAGDAQKVMEKANKEIKGSCFFMGLSKSLGSSAGEGARASVGSEVTATDLTKIGHQCQGFDGFSPRTSDSGAGVGVDAGAPALGGGGGGADGDAPKLPGRGVTQGSYGGGG